jgi:hypothetical protein
LEKCAIKIAILPINRGFWMMQSGKGTVSWGNRSNYSVRT